MISYIRQNFTPQFSLIVIPYFIFTFTCLYFSDVKWTYVIFFMTILGLLGNGVVGHRLIAHRQFTPAKWTIPILYLLCTLAAFAPVWYWRAQHWHHHKHSDQDIDVHSPHSQTFFDSFFGWALKQKFVKVVLTTEKRSLRESLSDKNMQFFYNYNYYLIYLFLLILASISIELLLAYFIFYWLEILRLGLITSLAHINIPFSYRNFETKDKSYNNLVIGYLTFGFGWHNNHHANPMLLDTQIKWWEFDLEAKLAKIINCIPGVKK